MLLERLQRSLVGLHIRWRPPEDRGKPVSDQGNNLCERKQGPLVNLCLLDAAGAEEAL